MQIKTTMKDDLTPVRMAIIKQEKKITTIGKDVDKGNLYTVGGTEN